MNARTASLLTALFVLATPLAFAPSAAAEWPVDCVSDEPSVDAACATAAPVGEADGLVASFDLGNAHPLPVVLLDAHGELTLKATAFAGSGETYAPYTGSLTLSIQFDCGGLTPALGGALACQGPSQMVAEAHAAAPTGAAHVFTFDGAELATAFGDANVVSGLHLFVGDGAGAYAHYNAATAGVSAETAPAFDTLEAQTFTPVVFVTAQADEGGVQLHSFDGIAIPVASLFPGQPAPTHDVYLGGGDADGDGDGDSTELLSCNSNPFNPATTCRDIDGDGLLAYERESTQAACAADGGTYADGVCLVDQESTCPGRDPGKACDANKWDTDGDGEPDGTDDFPTDATNGDPDRDGLLAAEEAACGTYPDDRDSDNDGLSDGPKDVNGQGATIAGANECAPGGTHPMVADTDGDGQNDGADPFPTDPTRKDTDGDGLLDAHEDSGIWNPYCARTTGPSVLVAATGDACTTGGPTNKAAKDSDGDALNDRAETNATTPTDPNNADTDGDGHDDKADPAPTDPAIPAAPDPCDPMGVPDTFDPTAEGCLPTDEADPDALCAAADLEGGFPDCLLGLLEGFPPEGPGELPVDSPLDLSDPWDTDGDGRRAEPNGQPDAVEQRLLYADPDEAADSIRERNGDLEGDGATLVVLDPRDTSTHPTVARVHVGDVAASPLAKELVVIETRAPAALVCVYQVGDAVRVAQGPGPYAAAAQDPCGAAATPWTPLNGVLANVPLLGPITVGDANGDLVPDSVTFTVPDPATCESGVGPAPVPNPTTCDGDAVTLPIADPSADALCGTAVGPVLEGADVCAAPPAGLAAEAGGPYTGAPGSAIAITGTASGATGTFTCAWSTQDDGTFANPAACETTVTFATAGQKSLTLTVKDSTNAEATDTATVTVETTGPSDPACVPDGLPDCAPGFVLESIGDVLEDGPGLTQCAPSDIPFDACFEEGKGPVLSMIPGFQYRLRIEIFGIYVAL